MGMSSSQARLLHLTSRMHQIEYKAAKLEAQKLQMANDSERAYADYLEVLEATKIQYNSLTADGILTFKDATLNAMENRIVGNWAGDTSKEILFMQDMNGKVYVTPTVAAKYGLTSTDIEDRDLDTFVRETTGKDKTQFPVYRQEAAYREEPNMVTKWRDSDQVESFTPIRNVVTTQLSTSSEHTYSPIENIEGGIDYSALDGYAKFDNRHAPTPAGAQAASSVTDWSTASGTYTISSAAELKGLSGKTIPAGVTLLLTQNIDMSGQTGWTGITSLAGTFDGNGYKISNLSGSQGLITNTVGGATVKNVGLENLNINGNSAYVGGLIANAANGTYTNCYSTGSIVNSYSGTIANMTSSSYSMGTGGLIGNINSPGGTVTIVDNVYSSATVTASNSDGVGGLIGSSTVLFSGDGQLDIKNAYAIGNVTGKNGVGGFMGVAYNDEDNDYDITDIRNCYSGGNVTGTNQVGGFFGSYLYWGDNGDYCEISDCNSSGKVTSTGSKKGAFAGHLYVKMASASTATLNNYLINFIRCGYAENTGAANAYGVITDENGNTNATVDGITSPITDFVQQSGSGAGLTSFKLAGNIPSIEADGSGDYMNNIIAALIKAGEYDPCDPELSAADKTAMETKIKNFLRSFSDNETDNAKLWHLNEAIVSYLNGVGVSDVGTKLAQDINNGTKTATSNFQTGAALDGKVVRGATTGAAAYTGTHNDTKGAVTIPSREDIAEQMYYALNMAGITYTLAEVQSYFNNHYSPVNADDKVFLANINDMISNGNINEILAAMQGGTKYTSTAKYNKDEWDITVAGNQDVQVKYVQEPYQEQDGTVQVFDHWEEVLDHYETRWDTTDPDIANAIGMYAMAQRGVIVVTEEQASSYEWLVNMANVGQAVFTTFNPEKVEDLARLVANDPTIINTMTDEEYELFMGIENTSVSVETCLQEVQDEKDLKKAEAIYEAKMRKIDNKDKKYDKELAALEAERNATKLAMDQLKKVANENVDRTFKLFS